MKTLDNKVIIYDDVCPLCKAYTAGFVKLGWLEKRTGFTDAPPEMLEKIDLDRARHEIPLYDSATGEVHYGLDALFLILGNKMPVFRPLFRSRIFWAILYPFYQLITFNRRLIAGSASPVSGFDCAPDVNLFWRSVFLILMVGGGLSFFRSVISFWETELSWIPKTALVLHGIFLFLTFFAKKRLDWLGLWATVFFGNMVLLRVLPTGFWLPVLPFLLAIFMAVRRWKLVV